MSRHEFTGWENRRELACGCEVWFEEGTRLLWIEACRGNCETIDECMRIGERRGFAVAVLDDRLWGQVRRWSRHS